MASVFELLDELGEALKTACAVHKDKKLILSVEMGRVGPLTYLHVDGVQVADGHRDIERHLQKLSQPKPEKVTVTVPYDVAEHYAKHIGDIPKCGVFMSRACAEAIAQYEMPK